MNNFVAALGLSAALLLLGSTKGIVRADPEATASACGQQLYSGIDSRLKLDIVGIVPYSEKPIVGFELVNHQPVIALPDQLLGIRVGSVMKTPIYNTVKGISVNDGFELLVQTDRGFETFGKSALKSDAEFTNVIHGRLYNSGNPVFVEARSNGKQVQFIARRRGGKSFLIADFLGDFAAASWSRVGLAAVVGDSLYYWEAGNKNLIRLLTDRGLNSARDVVLIAPGRVIVTLKSTVLLVTNDEVLILAGMGTARCRFDNDRDLLYLIDDRARVVWAVTGISQVGTRTGDKAHALDLLKHLPKQSGNGSPQFLEAARILGCDSARKELAAFKAAGSNVGAHPNK